MSICDVYIQVIEFFTFHLYVYEWMDACIHSFKNVSYPTFTTVVPSLAVLCLMNIKIVLILKSPNKYVLVSTQL